MSTVLILDADFPAGIESMQSLGRFGCTVHAAASASHCIAFRSRYASVKLQQPLALNDLIPWLIELDRQNKYSLIIPSTEISLSVFSDPRISSELRSKAVLPSPESLRLALNKEEVLQRAQSLAIPVPASTIACGALPNADLHYPIVLKPIFSKQRSGEEIIEHKVAYFHDSTKLAEFLGKFPDTSFQLQQRVAGRGVGVELLFYSGEPVWSFAHERIHEWPLTGGASSYRRSIKPPKLMLEYSIALLRLLQWHGVAMVEWKVAPDGTFFLIEINPRLWGSLALAIDAGVDFPRGLLSIAQGQTPPGAQPYRAGYFTRNITLDLNWLIANIAADHSDPELLTQPKLVALLQLLRPLLGKESWDFFDAKDLPVTAHLLKSYLRSKLGGLVRRLGLKLQTVRFLRGQHQKIASRFHAHPPLKLLFLCYGNICRSPVAGLLAARALPNVSVQSAGFHLRAGRPSPAKMIDIVLPLDIDLASHRSQLITADMVARSDLILVMDRKNYHQLLDNFPDAADKTTYLGLFAHPPNLEIPDPYDLTREQSAAVVDVIDRAVRNLVHSISPTANPGGDHIAALSMSSHP